MMFDTTNLLYDITDTNPQSTFSAKQNNVNIASRIDYRWTTHFLITIESSKLYKLNEAVDEEY